MKIKFIIIFGLLIHSTLSAQTSYEYLNDISEKVNGIKTASYKSEIASSAPGDTLAFNSYERFINMYVNPDDIFRGASFTSSLVNNSNEYDFCYDGTYCIRFDWQKREVEIDTLNNNTFLRPFASFFIRVGSLVTYALQNLDSTIVNHHTYKDTTRISFTFINRIAEFWSRYPRIENSHNKESRYDLYVDHNRIPFKLIRRMPHQTSWETCSDLIISNELDYSFNGISQIPSDFNVKGLVGKESSAVELEGKIASNWTLKEIDGNSLSLSDLDSKIIMIQFSGIGCGPCHASIPFLNKLVSDNKENNFELICIETWSKNISGIRRYKHINEINYRLLISDDQANSDYNIRSVPTFIILDENRMIKKVVVGYSKGLTDKEIGETISSLL